MLESRAYHRGTVSGAYVTEVQTVEPDCSGAEQGACDWLESE